VPEIVTTFEAHVPLTPAGRPVTVAPVALVVEYVILVTGELIQTVWAIVPAAEVRLIVLTGLTVIEPDAVTAPQPPFSVTV
jgi:hypothetical protein